MRFDIGMHVRTRHTAAGAKRLHLVVHWKASTLLVLRSLFAVALFWRFAYVFDTNPLDHMYSDPARHWENASNFWEPYFWGSVDPLMYQVYLALVQLLSGSTAFGIALFTGVLSAAMPWFWYRALKECVPKLWALGGGIAIALMPSLTMIYSYFMNETLLLTLLGAATWLTLRAFRVRTMEAFTWAASLWALAGYTRFIAVPLGVLSLGCLLLHDARRSRSKLCIAAAAYALLAIPACWHSEVNLHFYRPFGLDYMNEAYRAANTRKFTLKVMTKQQYVIGYPGLFNKPYASFGDWARTFYKPFAPGYLDRPDHTKKFAIGVNIPTGYEFSSPSFYTHPFAPFSNWTRQQTGDVLIQVNTSNGSADWQTELARIKAQYGPTYSAWDSFVDNAITLFFDPSWPDDNADYWLGGLAMLNRWLWLPLTLAVGVMAWQTRIHTRNWQCRLPVMLAALTLVLLLFQTAAVMEGRYRKPLEPLLLASFTVLLHERRKAQGNFIRR